MIISNQQVQSILRLQQAAFTKKTVYQGSASATKKSDTLELSGRVREMQSVKEQVLKSPDVRVDRVSDLQQRIQSGNYQISGDEIASKIISRSLVDELAGR